MGKALFALSRRLHRYAGLLLLLYLIFVGVTGILLNHPTMISALSVPRWLVPPSYQIEEWNRGSLRSVVFSEREPSVGFVAGTEGIWKTTDGGVTFEPMASGYPRSRALRRTNHIVLLEEEEAPARLLAATRGGLFVASVDDAEWRRIPLAPGDEHVRKILRIGERLVVFTNSNAYEAYGEAGGDLPHFTLVDPDRLHGGEGGTTEGVSLVRLMFALHSGAVWGMPGRLLIDAAGVALIFLSASAIYLWYFPRSRRRSAGAPRKDGIGRRLFPWLFKYHLKIGVWATLFLILFAGTALFMPPSPLVPMTVRKVVPPQYWPGPLPANPWHGNIGNATYDPVRDEILVELRGGTGRSVWRAPADFSTPFARDAARLPIGAMGSNVLEIKADGTLVVGSFSGLYQRSAGGGALIDLSTGEPADPRPFRRGEGGWQTAGYFETPSGERFVVTHDEGLIGIGGAQPNGRFKMPDELKQGYRMPLWSFLFEVHNGRILRDWLSSHYYLISFLGALSLLLITFTGLFDWAYRKLPARPGKGRPEKRKEDPAK
ncbi:PepSY-associated TM helix domain-containing protein [Geoalkalibacter halelectricus]|uniref:PepSY-associated TM helix domain-containing protein n=1 Tax=Geoalkalibacter halelectricus TaxID=2847045 RepID=UPI00267094F7|nr:PepSY-associated TM helix domain-containing protein [Geoalkalibacter halelectricus]MDO3380322.1 PepSY domain-containing protein [Geoalkalibacter halelectricus]